MPQFLAVYTGSPDSPMGPGDLDPAEIGRGMDAWGKWMADNASRVVVTGGPLGKTKKVSKAGVQDIRNLLVGFVVVEAADHDEAARLFLNHPHFSIFPGEGVEVMEMLPIPTR
eukprot:gene21646-21596_t